MNRRVKPGDIINRSNRKAKRCAIENAKNYSDTRMEFESGGGIILMSGTYYIN